MITDYLTPALLQGTLVGLVIAALLGDAVRMRRLKERTSAAGRLAAFQTTTAGLWAAALLALPLAMPHDLFAVRITGGALACLLASPVASTASLALATLYFALALAPGLHCVLKPAARQTYSAALASLRYMLPVSPHERRWWVAVSISAGICEEVVFRGFLPQFLTGQLHGEWTLDPLVAWLLSALAFGLCHAYQGAAGVVRTTLAALMFSVVAMLSGSLLLPVVLHILVDLAVLPLYRPLLDNRVAATPGQRG